jgi:predicted nucleotidyltransferase
MLVETLRRITGFLETNMVPYMIIGGYALPFYGRIRTTLDIDIAVALGDHDYKAFCDKAETAGYSTALTAELNPYSVFLDTVTGYEIEIWRAPDGVTWDQETLRRRNRFMVEGLEVFVISAEDFIVTKLARADRSNSDEMDVLSVLVRMGNALDWEYLTGRVENAQVEHLLEAIREKT